MTTHIEASADLTKGVVDLTTIRLGCEFIAWTAPPTATKEIDLFFGLKQPINMKEIFCWFINIESEN